MTVVNPKSISGINSITMASGDDNLLTIHSNNTTERVRVDSSGNLTATSFSGDGSSLTGVASTENIRTNTNATFLQNINVSGTSTVTGTSTLGIVVGTSFTATGPTGQTAFINQHAVGVGSTTTTGKFAGVGTDAGTIVFDVTKGTLEFFTGSLWVNVSARQPTISSITGNIIAGTADTLTLAGTEFGTANLVVKFVQSSDSIDTSTTVTPTSSTAASVAVPAAVYNNVTAGNTVTITVTNSDGLESAGATKDAIALPSGGTITTSGDYRIHTFLSSGTFVNTIADLSVEYLVIAGGGGGGTADTGAAARGGGGGAGGYRTNVPGQTSGGNSSAEAALTLSTGNKTVTVGAGGAGGSGSQNAIGSNGGDSVFDSITSIGGGRGGANTTAASSGGSGGGGEESNGSGASGTSGQGTGGGDGTESGNRGGGGGGAGQAGSGTTGGNGLSSNITGSAVTRGGGGGTTSSGGSGGGGAGGSVNGTDGTANTGGGGGAAHTNAGDGGSGIVIVRYDLTAI